MRRTQFNRALTALELEALTESAKLGSVQVLTAFYALAGVPLDGPGDQIAPTAFRIPAGQWGTICEAITDLGGRLQWMNVGPSGGLS